MSDLWHDLARRSGTPLDGRQVDKLGRYLDLLLAANERMNLTRVTDRADAEARHVADALTLLPHLPPDPFSLADLGSGGGVPGLPLAIARPDAAVTLVEATGKKADFLKTAAYELGLRNVTVALGRAEQVGRGPLRGTLDVVTSRAAGSTAFLVEWAMPLLRVGGVLLAQKGERHTDELADAKVALRLLGCFPPVVHPVDLPGVSGSVIVEVGKARPTSEKYPRSATDAKKRPLSR